MKRTPKLFLLSAVLFFSTLVQAQSCDPWITEIYQQIYGRRPTAQECNIKNYNNGSWNSKCELTSFIVFYNNSRSGDFIKGDSWIFKAYCELYSRIPNLWELNTQNYNNGSWGNYDELKKHIQSYQTTLSQNSIKVVVGDLKGKPAALFFDNNKNPFAVDLLAKDGGKVVASGGGNVIATGGGNVIAVGGGNVVAPGGANLTISPNMAGVSFGSDRTIQSAGSRVIPIGKTKLVIK